MKELCAELEEISATLKVLNAVLERRLETTDNPLRLSEELDAVLGKYGAPSKDQREKDMAYEAGRTPPQGEVGGIRRGMGLPQGWA